ncbi:GIY-YIG nuclease family protein [Shewanella sp. 1_MG-2023]|uniref:GIY-YIG nuclease family protein n=1 Tax=unclassified Shewanella TaxID=196818 RepID=UPI0026E1BE45|nr:MULTISPECIES: GIY-YIG nuclease family protein [unclassified Shewanella]MDO6612273.1 GIY-YIG nuclease family protein [Shewanella sp. 7_MG-2023]MDO6772127.1 GIY-YIG nuclease family protein [Shewanella sp. 2_MG-2023]MDO6794033.1 GIY-YIG nuclease family protein [Shewanella sp. 1_MG-2023]
MYAVVTKNLKAFKVKIAEHVIYAHKNRKGQVYIGQSRCMVNRWAEHQQIANSPLHPEHNQAFKKSLRDEKVWQHYIIAIADNQKEADEAETSAIDFYKPQLNSQPGIGIPKPEVYGFLPLNGDGREISLEAKTITRYRKQERFCDKERRIIKCRTIRKAGKSHISFECIDDGYRVNISYEKRLAFNVGDIVSISYAAKGKGIYTTTDYSEITLD